MASRPDVPDGYLGSQPKFSELGLSAMSHIEPEIFLNDNQVEIKLKCNKGPVKVTHQLICCRTDKELSEYVFTQTLHGVVTFIVNLPESGFYKFQIFALPVDDDSKSLPNVYNYLINCNRALLPVFPFPKQYAQWKDGCFLHEPLCLHKDSKLTNIKWKVNIPNAKAVAVVVDGDWHHFEKKGNHWEGCFSLDQYRGKDKKVTVNANVGPDETKFATYLEYTI